MGVGALLEVDELAGAVVEGGVGEAEGGVERVGDLLVGVGVAGVGDRGLFEEGGGGVVGVLRVDPEEGDPLAVTRRELLQDRELEAAGAAPGGPDVGDDRVALQRGDPLFVGVGPAREQLVGLGVQRRQRCGGAGQGASRSRGACRRSRRPRRSRSRSPPRAGSASRESAMRRVRRVVIRSVITIRTFGPLVMRAAEIVGETGYGSPAPSFTCLQPYVSCSAEAEPRSLLWPRPAMLPRKRQFLQAPTSSVRRSSPASRSCSTARGPRRWRRGRPAAVPSTRR